MKIRARLGRPFEEDFATLEVNLSDKGWLLDPSAVSIGLTSDMRRPELRGMMLEIREIVAARSRRSQRFIRRFMGLSAALIYAFALPLTFVTHDRTVRVISAFWLMLAIPLGLLATFWRADSMVIRPQWRHDRQGWWRVHRDDVVVAALSAAIGGVVGSLTTALIGR